MSQVMSEAKYTLGLMGWVFIILGALSISCWSFPRNREQKFSVSRPPCFLAITSLKT